MHGTDGGGIVGLVARARHTAQRRGQKPSSAHLLLAIAQASRSGGQWLEGHGISEHGVLSSLDSTSNRSREESTSTLERIVERAEKLAKRSATSPSSLHLLLAITRESRSDAHRAIGAMGCSPAGLQQALLSDLGLPSLRSGRAKSRFGAGDAMSREEVFDPRPGAIRAVRRAPSQRRARRPASQHEAPTSEKDLATTPGVTLAPDLETPPAPARTNRVPNRRAPKNRRRAPSARRSRNSAELPSLEAQLALGATNQQELPKTRLDPDRFPLLTKLGSNLTQRAEEGKLDPVIGRSPEIAKVRDVLARRRGNNPLLVGAPGVGKTAIAEGLAQELLREDPELSLIQVSGGGLMAGTGVRGALSKRIASLAEEVKQADGKVVLFLDEIHSLLSPEAEELTQELKIRLGRGELPCIGATTDAEFRRCFDKDAALARRFTVVQVEEPDLKTAAEIVTGVLPSYAKHHGLRYEAETAEAAVALSSRFLVEQRLPDKAVSVIDLAGAKVARRGGCEVTRSEIAEVIAERAGIQVERLLRTDAERLLQMEDLLGKRVIGHREILSAVSETLRKGAAGFFPNRPLGSFLFLGPTGVGKTELAKAISDEFFGTPMTRIDMSEYSEKHTVARLLGSPPGYVGHAEGGELTEAVRKRPYQLVLLDEIEKAHRDVLLALLPLLDEGHLTDARGRRVDFKNTIIVMTSNLGVRTIKKRSVGFGSAEPNAESHDEHQVIASARAALPPELFGRIEEPLVFASLTRSDVHAIAKQLISTVATQAETQGVRLEVTEPAIELLVDRGFDPTLGARPLRRAISRGLESPLATLVLRGTQGIVDVGVEGGELSFVPRDEAN